MSAGTDTSVLVLLVEDDPVWTDTIRELLAQVTWGPPVTIQAAHTLAGALASIRDHAFDALLVDLNLPDSSGAKTISSLRLAAPGTPLVVLTSSEEKGIIEEALALGAQDFIGKSDANGNNLARILWFAIRRDEARRALVQAATRLRGEADTLRAAGVPCGLLDETVRSLLSIERDLLEKSEQMSHGAG